MEEKLKKVLDFFKAAIGILHGVGSEFKFVVLAIILAFVVLWVVIAGILEVTKTIKEKNEGLVKAEKRFPRFFGVLYSGKVRFFLLVVVLLLFAIDWRDASTISPPKFEPPPPPIGETRVITVQEPSKPVALPGSPSPTAPIGAPQAPRSPQPQTSANAPTAYSELMAVKGEVDNLQNDWDDRTQLPRKQRGLSDNLPNANLAEDEKIFTGQIVHVEDGILPRWVDIRPAVLKAHGDAVNRMKQTVTGDPPRMTRNAEKDDALDFGKAIGEADMPTMELVEARKEPDFDRFRALSKYLGSLIDTLGDYQ
jgi:hypothetical protein